MREKYILLIVCMFGMICLILSPSAFSQTHERKSNSQNISIMNLEQGKIVADEYLVLIKAEKYDEAFDRYHYNPTNYTQEKIKEEGMYFVELMKIYAEELGNITDYNYREYKWEDARRWASGKIDPASLTLIYEVQYTKDKTDTTIKIVQDNHELKVSSFGIKYSLSLEAMQRMMSLQTKVKELIKKLKNTDNY